MPVHHNLLQCRAQSLIFPLTHSLTNSLTHPASWPVISQPASQPVPAPRLPWWFCAQPAVPVYHRPAVPSASFSPVPVPLGVVPCGIKIKLPGTAPRPPYRCRRDLPCPFSIRLFFDFLLVVFLLAASLLGGDGAHHLLRRMQSNLKREALVRLAWTARRGPQRQFIIRYGDLSGLNWYLYLYLYLDLGIQPHHSKMSRLPEPSPPRSYVHLLLEAIAANLGTRPRAHAPTRPPIIHLPTAWVLLARLDFQTSEVCLGYFCFGLEFGKCRPRSRLLFPLDCPALQYEAVVSHLVVPRPWL